MQVGGALLIVVGGSRGCGLRISATQEVILEQHPILTARKCAITLVAAGFLISPLAACNAQEQAAQTESGLAAIKEGMLYSEVVAVLGLGEAGKVPVEYPIHCDSWKYNDGMGDKFININFWSGMSDNIVETVSDDNEESCFPHLVMQGSPADSVKVGMTRAEVISALKSPYFTTGTREGDSSRDSFAYVQNGEVRYLIIGYQYDSSINSPEPLVVFSVSDDNYGPYGIE
jgi:hypothetical protein